MSSSNGGGAPVRCPIPKEKLLEMVREEARIRVSEEFQKKVAKEEAEAKTDGTSSITQMQVGVIYRSLKYFNIRQSSSSSSSSSSHSSSHSSSSSSSSSSNNKGEATTEATATIIGNFF